MLTPEHNATATRKPSKVDSFPYNTFTMAPTPTQKLLEQRRRSSNPYIVLADLPSESDSEDEPRVVIETRSGPDASSTNDNINIPSPELVHSSDLQNDAGTTTPENTGLGREHPTMPPSTGARQFSSPADYLTEPPIGRPVSNEDGFTLTRGQDQSQPTNSSQMRGVSNFDGLWTNSSPWRDHAKKNQDNGREEADGKQSVTESVEQRRGNAPDTPGAPEGRVTPSRDEVTEEAVTAETDQRSRARTKCSGRTAPSCR
jgi:hypothetical protein